MKIQYTEYNKQTTTWEFTLSAETLKEYDLSEGDVRSFIENPENAPDDVHDKMYELRHDLEGDLMNEDDFFDGDEWEITDESS